MLCVFYIFLLIYVTINADISTTKSIAKVYYRDFKNINLQAFICPLNTFTLKDILYIADLVNKVHLFTELLINLFDISAPVKTARVTKNTDLWLIPTLVVFSKSS